MSNNRLVTKTAAQTRTIARSLSMLVKPGTVVGLVGDLGAGKTTFVAGLCEGLMHSTPFVVSSPSYTLIHEYPTTPPVIHVDLYRLSTYSDLESIGYWDYVDGETIVVVEWADRIADCLPDKHLKLLFDILDDGGRAIEVMSFGAEYEVIRRALCERSG